MKLLEIDTTDTQIILKVAGSKVAHVAKRDNADEIRQTLLDVLAETPETRVTPEPEVPEAIDEIQGSIGEILEGIGNLLNSPGAMKARKALEKLPKARRHGQSG